MLPEVGRGNTNPTQGIRELCLHGLWGIRALISAVMATWAALRKQDFENRHMRISQTHLTPDTIPQIGDFLCHQGYAHLVSHGSRSQYSLKGWVALAPLFWGAVAPACTRFPGAWPGTTEALCWKPGVGLRPRRTHRGLGGLGGPGRSLAHL